MKQHVEAIAPRDLQRSFVSLSLFARTTSFFGIALPLHRDAITAKRASTEHLRYLELGRLLLAVENEEGMGAGALAGLLDEAQGGNECGLAPEWAWASNKACFKYADSKEACNEGRSKQNQNSRNTITQEMRKKDKKPELRVNSLRMERLSRNLLGGCKIKLLGGQTTSCIVHNEWTRVHGMQ
eukprot:scaffold176946_cov21-Tisochrysis_lutea.AAC.1